MEGEEENPRNGADKKGMGLRDRHQGSGKEPGQRSGVARMDHSPVLSNTFRSQPSLLNGRRSQHLTTARSPEQTRTSAVSLPHIVLKQTGEVILHPGLDPGFRLQSEGVLKGREEGVRIHDPGQNPGEIQP